MSVLTGGSETADSPLFWDGLSKHFQCPIQSCLLSYTYYRKSNFMFHPAAFYTSDNLKKIDIFFWVYPSGSLLLIHRKKPFVILIIFKYSGLGILTQPPLWEIDNNR